MAAAPNTLPAKWQMIAWQKKDEQFARIPADWILPLSVSPSPDVKSYIDVPRKCGLLSAEELRITEEYDAVGLAEAVRERKYRCVDVARAFCKRAAIAHQLTNCLTEILFDAALDRARHLDAHLDAGNPPLGPLHGIPVSLKDTFKIAGYDASIGIAALVFNPATQNSVLVDALLTAGAVLYCKTQIPQTLMALDSHNNVFGRTLNPLNTDVTAGGSSGGEGALLAMRGSVLGVGTDVGGSIRIPAMCNGLYGVKPSAARVPYAGQEGGVQPGMAKVGIPASAGPLARSVRDIELFFEVVGAQKTWTRDPDVVPGAWTSLASLYEEGASKKKKEKRKLRIGIVRRDGVMEPHPPILGALDEVSKKMRAAGIEVVDMDITPLFSRCQSLANGLFNIEGNNAMFDLLESTGEPLSPWLATRLKRKKPATLDKVRELQGKRTELQTEFLKIWKDATGQEIDAIVCPVAPHPVPPVDRWNGVSYTSSWVLLDYPAGVVPVRKFRESDLQGEVEGTPKGAWDKANRELWTGVDRKVYVGTPLSVQVVAPKLQERKLVEAMAAIDQAIKGEGKAVAAKL